MTKRQADLGPLLLAGGADAAELAGEGHQLLVAARAAADPGEPCGKDPAAARRLEASPEAWKQARQLLEAIEQARQCGQPETRR
jgi:hypothetical protein